LWEGLLAFALPGCEAVGVPFVKARRAIGFACRNAEAPLRRAERAASWAMEFMMIAEGIDDGEWSFGCWGCYWKVGKRWKTGTIKMAPRVRYYPATNALQISLIVDHTGCVASSSDCHFTQKVTKTYYLDLAIG
jgi:hypothetical protein